MYAIGLASYMYTGLLGPLFNFITLITNVGKEGLVKFVVCNDVPGHQVEMLRSGTCLLYSCEQLSELEKHCQDCLMLNAQSSVGTVSDKHCGEKAWVVGYCRPLQTGLGKAKEWGIEMSRGCCSS